MAKLTLTDIAGGYGLVATYNANNDLIEAALENTLSRDGTAPNTMGANLDMNSNRVVNLSDPSGNQDAATKTYVDTSITNLYAGQVDFSTGANYTITGAWTFSGNQNFTGDLVVSDGGTDDMTLKALTGDDFAIENDTGAVDAGLFFNDWQDVYFDNGAKIQVRDAAQADSYAIQADGSNLVFSLEAGSGDFRVDSSFINADFDCNVIIEDGHELRIYDDAEDDYGYFLHTGSEFEIRTTGSGSGQVPLSLNPGGVQPVIIETGALMIAEASGAVTDIAAHGQFWVKDDTPNVPKFTDDAGTDFDIPILENGSFTGTLTGCTTSPTATFQYIKEKLPGGYFRVTIWNEAALTATSNSVACSITGLPAALTPTSQTGRMVGECRDNGNGVACLALLAASGTTISLSIESGGTWSSLGFTNSGNKGINVGTTFMFIID